LGARKIGVKCIDGNHQTCDFLSKLYEDRISGIVISITVNTGRQDAVSYEEYFHFGNDPDCVVTTLYFVLLYSPIFFKGDLYVLKL
jgi:hypothetical protein